MACRLGEYVTYGELYTTSHYGVFGFLVLRTEAGDAGGEHTFIRLELTGDPDPDLQDMHVCFEPEEGAEIKYFRPEEHPGLRERQYGATGTMTARGWVRTLPCSEEEFMARSRLGEPPPTPWKNRLYLEWYGPNGRAVVELAGPLVEVCTREPDEADETDWGDWAPLPNTAPKPAPWCPDDDPGDIEITVIHADGVSETCTGIDYLAGEGPDFERVLGCGAGDEIVGSGGSGDADSDPFRLERRPREGFREETDRYPLLHALRGINALPHPDDLDDMAVEVQLKVLLGQLALIGVALHVCDHCRPRDAYRLLLDRILPELGAGEICPADGSCRTIMASAYCRHCAAEARGESGVAIWN